MSVAWITGGGTGIGFAIAKGLCRQGSKVIITGRRPEPLEDSVRMIMSGKPAGEVIAVPGDAADPAHAKQVIHLVNKRWGTIELLVNNAGANDHKSIDESTLENYKKSFEINCLSAINCVSVVLPGMLGIKRGVVVNIASVLGKWASFGSASYSIGKYALAGYTDALRQHLVGSPIHVMGVYPGFIRTALTLPFVKPGSWKAGFGKTPEQMAAAILKAIQYRKAELYYPWYVPWALRLHRWMPVLADRMARKAKT